MDLMHLTLSYFVLAIPTINYYFSTFIRLRLCWKTPRPSQPHSLTLTYPLRRLISIRHQNKFFISIIIFNKMLQSVIIVIIVIHVRLLFHHKNNKNLWRQTSAAVNHQALQSMYYAQRILLK